MLALATSALSFSINTPLAPSRSAAAIRMADTCANAPHHLLARSRTPSPTDTTEWITALAAIRA